MVRRILAATSLIPTDRPRRLRSILDPIRLYVERLGNEIPAVVVLPYKQEYFVCSGNHRAAAAYICGRHVDAVVLAQDGDLSVLTQGPVAEARSVKQLRDRCLDQAERRRYLTGRWREYLKDLGALRVDLD